MKKVSSLVIFYTIFVTHGFQTNFGFLKKFDECSPKNHQLLDENWRFHEYISETIIQESDNALKPGWYRFKNLASRLLEKDELYDLVTRNRTTFHPCGTRDFEGFKFLPQPPRFLTSTTPLYVLDGKHPDIKGELMKTKAVECYYQSVTQLLLGIGSGSVPASCDPVNKNPCKFEHLCLNSITVDIKIRHCGAFYVYNLVPVRKIPQDFSFPILKDGLYCGSQDSTLPSSSAPCLCQIPDDVEEIVDKTKCNVNYEGSDKKVLKGIFKCLKKERRMLSKHIIWSAKCNGKLLKQKLKNNSKFPASEIQNRLNECSGLKKRMIKGLANKANLLIACKGKIYYGGWKL